MTQLLMSAFITFMQLLAENFNVIFAANILSKIGSSFYDIHRILSLMFV